MFSDIQRLFKHSSIYSLGNAAMRAGGFILLPLYTRYLTVAEYGILELLYSISAIATSFLSIGIAHATLRFYFEYDDIEDRKAVISTSLLTSFLITIPSLFLLSFFNSIISFWVFDTTEYTLALCLVYIIIVFEMGRQIGLSYMRAKEYSILFVSVSITQLIIQVACNIYTVAVLKMGVVGILVGNMISVFSGLVICTFVIIKECGIRYDLSKIKEILKYSYPFLFTSVTNVVLQNADRFILKTFLSMEAVGIYGLAIKFGMLLRELIIEPFQRSFGAFRFSVMKQDNAQDIQARTLNYLVFIVAWAGLGISLFGHDLINLLATPEYYAVSTFIPIIVLSLIIGCFNYIFQTGILFQKDTIKLFYVSLTSGIAGVCLSFLLIFYFGIYGACFTLVLKNLLTIFLTNRLSQKFFKVNYTYGKVALSVFIAAIIYGVSLSLSNDFIIISIVTKGLIWTLYPYIIYKINFFTLDEIKICTNFLEKNKFYRKIFNPNIAPS